MKLCQSRLMVRVYMYILWSCSVPNNLVLGLAGSVEIEDENLYPDNRVVD